MAEQLKAVKRDVFYVIVNEAGASVYSASEVARKEFPDLQVEERSAVSIARRLQDPLAEVVKLIPKQSGSVNISMTYRKTSCRAIGFCCRNCGKPSWC